MTNSINLKNNKSNGLSLSLLAAAIAILSAPALAQGGNTTDVNAAREAVAHAGRMAETPTVSLKSDRERLHQDSGGSIENKQTIDAAAARAQAYSNLAAAEAREAHLQFINDSVARADQRQAVADRYGDKAALSVQNAIQNQATHLDGNVMAAQQGRARSDAAVAVADARQADIDH